MAQRILTLRKIKEILREHIINGNIIEKYALAMGSERTH